MISEQGLFERERLIGDKFRETYQRPFYTWSHSDESRRQLIEEYGIYLDRLKHSEVNEANAYRINILRELLQDLE